MLNCCKSRKYLSDEDRDWTSQAVDLLQTDGKRSADTHMIKPDFPGLRGISIYLKDKSTHPTAA